MITAKEAKEKTQAAILDKELPSLEQKILEACEGEMSRLYVKTAGATLVEHLRKNGFVVDPCDQGGFEISWE
jgi:hypothetical protein